MTKIGSTTSYAILIGASFLLFQGRTIASFVLFGNGVCVRKSLRHDIVTMSSPSRLTSESNSFVRFGSETSRRVPSSIFALRSKSEGANDEIWNGFNNNCNKEEKNHGMNNYGRNGNDFDIQAERIRLESLLVASAACVEDSYKSLYLGLDERNEKLATLAYNFLPPVMRLFHESDPTKFDEFQLPIPPPLTSIDRKRKETEIQLLRELKHTDSPIEQLCDLWYNERGPEAATLLRKADELIQQGTSGYDEAHKILLELIKMHGVHWVEPSNRLATLYYLRGNLKVSEAICSVVLTVKPWHFGASSGLSMVYRGLGDIDKANLWLDRSLPLRTSVDNGNTNREQWVEDSVNKAMGKLNDAENILQQLFGEKDLHIPESSKISTNIVTVDENDNWQ